MESVVHPLDRWWNRQEIWGLKTEHWNYIRATVVDDMRNSSCGCAWGSFRNFLTRIDVELVSDIRYLVDFLPHDSSTRSPFLQLRMNSLRIGVEENSGFNKTQLEPISTLFTGSGRVRL